jgi:hypothetical protein
MFIGKINDHGFATCSGKSCRAACLVSEENIDEYLDPTNVIEVECGECHKLQYYRIEEGKVTLIKPVIKIPEPVRAE